MSLNTKILIICYICDNVLRDLLSFLLKKEKYVLKFYLLFEYKSYNYLNYIID